MMDLDATKINGDPQPPDEINSIFDENKTIISSLGISFNAGSIQQLAQSILVHSMIGSYYADGGTANSYVLSSVPVTRKNPPSYFTGMEVYFLPANTNTGASTINVTGLGSKSIVLQDGSTALSGGEITINIITRLIYDGTNFRLANIDYTFDSDIFDVIGNNVSLKTASFVSSTIDLSSHSSDTEYSIAHGLGTDIKRVEVQWTDGTYWYVIATGIDAGNDLGTGVRWNSTNIYYGSVNKICNGGYLYTIGAATVAPNYNQGYFRFLAWK